MSDKENGKNSVLTPSGRARRRFLERTALAAASTSAAAVLPGMAVTASQNSPGVSPAHCLDVKIPMKDVAGKVAFITGGASGIGLGIAKAFVSAGMKVVIADINEERIKDTLAYFAAANPSAQVHGIRVNVTDRPAMEQAAAETVKVFGKIHVLVNNAGIVAYPPLLRTTYADWDRVMNVNVNGVFNGVHVFVPLLQSHGEGGQVITTSSLGGLFAVVPVHGSYIPSKFAVVGMMEQLRMELADANIGVSVYCAGPVRTNLKDSSLSPEIARETFAEVKQKDLFRVGSLSSDEGSTSIDSLEAGRHVLQGMRNNNLYIFTSPEFAAVIRDRTEALLSSSPPDVRPNDTQVKWAQALGRDSIYSTERKRRRCAQMGSTKATK